MKEVKTCCRCKQVKDIQVFVKNRPECKECKRAISREWAKDNYEKNLLMHKVSYWKLKAKALEVKLKEPTELIAVAPSEGLFGIEGLTTIEQGLNNL